MAEIAIPLIALGSMYVISNQDKEKNREGYANPGRNPNELPGVVPPPHDHCHHGDSGRETGHRDQYARGCDHTDRWLRPEG